MNAHVKFFEADATVPAGAPWKHLPATQQHTQEFAANESLFCEGDDTNYIYEILEGVVCCYRLTCDGRRQVLSFSYPGELIGLVQEDQYRYSGVALSYVRIRRIPKNALLKTAAKRPELGQRLLQFATSELAMMQDHFVTLGRKSATEKVASFLLLLCKKGSDDEAGTCTIDLPMTRADIADYLGLTLETVSRQISKLKIAGVIDLPQPQTIVVRDIFELESAAEATDGAY